MAMNEANAAVMKRSAFLWIAADLILGLNIFAAYQGSEAVIYGALAVTGLFALVGIGFGVWVGRMVAKAAAAPR